MTEKLQPKNLELSVRTPEQLGAALLRFRKLVSWTQQEAGAQSAVKQAMVSRVETGATGTSLGTLFKLLAGLDLELVVRRRRKAR